MRSESKIKGLEELKAIVAALKAEGKRIVFTNGCFDLLHVGHVAYLEEARSYGDVLIVGLNSDASVKRIKGPQRPIMPEWARARMLAALWAVDYVVVFEEETPLRVIRELKPHVLVKGGDWKEEQVIGRELVEEVKITPYLEGFSTTALVRKIKGLPMETSEEFLAGKDQ